MKKYLMSAQIPGAPQELLKELICRYSPSGEESEVFSYLAGLLKAVGFIEVVKKKEFIFFATKGLAQIQAKPKILVLEAHADVVPPHVNFSEDAEHIYGRGACDTKASIASMVIAGIKAKEAGLRFGLLFVADEEVSLSGSKAAAEFFQQEKLNPFFIVGEPTSLAPINGNYGGAAYQIKTHGTKAHSSKPEEGYNALHKLLFKIVPIIKKITRIAQKNGTVFVCTMSESGTASNIIPDVASLTVNIRQNPYDDHDYRELLKKTIGGLGEVIEVVKIPSIFCPIPTRLYFLGEGETAKFCSDLAYLKNGLILGPGNIAFAHKDKEQVLKADLDRAVEMYFNIIEKWELKKGGDSVV